MVVFGTIKSNQWQTNSVYYRGFNTGNNSSTGNGFKQGAQMFLDVLGSTEFPIASQLGDIGSGIISLYDGDYLGAGMSFAGTVIPGLSQAKLLKSGLHVSEQIAHAAKGVIQVKSKVFLVTKEGVVLPKGAKIPSQFIENVHRSSTYGLMENGKFIERLRIDPERFAEPSHFHINGKGRKLTKWRWY